MLAAGVALSVVAAVGLAGQALFVRLATRHGRTTDVLVVVLAVNLLVYVPGAVVLGEWQVTPVGLAAFAAAGVVASVLGRAAFYAGIRRIGASRADPIKASMPLHATVLAALLLGEAVTAPQFAGIVAVVVGVALVSREGAAADRAAGRAGSWVGPALPLAGAVLFGVEPVLATVGFRAGSSVAVGLAVKTGAAAIGFLGYLAWRDHIPRPSEFEPGFVRPALLAGVGNTGFLVAYYAALEVSRVGVVVPITQTSPLLVVAVSGLFMGDLERVTPRLVAAAGVVVAGAVAVTLAG